MTARGVMPVHKKGQSGVLFINTAAGTSRHREYAIFNPLSPVLGCSRARASVPRRILLSFSAKIHGAAARSRRSSFGKYCREISASNRDIDANPKLFVG